MLRTLKKKLAVNSSRKYIDAHMAAAARSVPPGSLILDAGAGPCQYRHLFSQHEYEAADFARVSGKVYGELTYVCDLRSIPVEADRYDLVVMTQVLEHLPEPLDVLRELCRVLKPGARLWMNQPFFYEEHEQPFDFYRYTQFGLRHLLEKAGFRVVSVEWGEGYCGTLSYQLDTTARYLPSSPAAYGGGLAGASAALLSLAVRPSAFLLSLLYARLDLRHKHTASGFCKNYFAVAEKPQGDSG